jgi:hypothetical protein
MGNKAFFLHNRYTIIVLIGLVILIAANWLWPSTVNLNPRNFYAYGIGFALAMISMGCVFNNSSPRIFFYGALIAPEIASIIGCWIQIIYNYAVGIDRNIIPTIDAFRAFSIMPYFLARVWILSVVLLAFFFLDFDWLSNRNYCKRPLI